MTVGTHRFSMVGSISRLAKARSDGWTPTRPLGGWLTVFGLIGPNGGVVPVVDRDDQIMDAAAELGRIDWTGYLRNGVWNDTHKPGTVVGVPTGLEFHDGTTELSQAHGKIGFWTTGHLLDPADPDSWQLHIPRERWPSPRDLERADYFWNRAELLAGTPRPLMFSAEGLLALSECGKRILYAKVNDAAVAELGVNPATTAEPLPFHLLAKGMSEDDPCASCSCPPSLRCARVVPLAPPGRTLAQRLTDHGLSPGLAHRAARRATHKEIDHARR